MDKPTRWRFFDAFSLEPKVHAQKNKAEELTYLESEDFQERLREAENGDYEACLSIALCYQLGTCVKASQSKAFDYFQLAAQHGSKKALYYLGRCYLTGEGVTLSKEKAFYCFKLAVDAGVQQATTPLAQCYFQGTGVKKDYNTANTLFLHAAELGDRSAYEALSSIYKAGLGVAPSLEKSDYFFAKAVELYTVDADLGDPFAQVILGDFFMHGRGVNKSEECGIDYFRRAASQDYPWAKVRLAECYSQGIGVEKSDEKAMKLYEEAIKFDMEYKFDYAEFLLENKIHHTKAIQYLRELAQALPNSNIFKQFALQKLAICYEDGIGVNACYQTALRFYTLAADLDDKASCLRLGSAYMEGGLGLFQNKHLGLEYLRIAIDLGHAATWILLGRYYFNGTGVEKSYKKSKQCFEKAKSNGFAVTKHLKACDYKLKRLSQQLGYEFLHNRRWKSGYVDRKQTKQVID